MSKKTLVILAIVGAVFACSKDKAEEYLPLDSELADKLDAASNGIGSSYYLLPSSTDLASIPQDPNNPLTLEKIELGKLLFHEAALGTEPDKTIGLQEFSCSSCHHAGAGFQSGTKQAVAEGGSGFGINGESRVFNPLYEEDSLDVQPIRALATLNTAFQRNLLWNGSLGATAANVGTEIKWIIGAQTGFNFLGYEGVETASIAGLDFHRMGLDSAWAHSYGYDGLFDAAFPFVPESDRYTVETAGLAIAAYLRVVMASESPFQRYLKGDLAAMNYKEKEGAILFFGKARCFNCHNGPALNSEQFACLAMDDFAEGVETFHFTGQLYHARGGRGDFTEIPSDYYQFKVPQLYNLRDVSFLGHGGSFSNIREVLEYKNNGIPENSVPAPEDISPLFHALNLTPEELDYLTEFVANALYDPYLERYVPDTVLSGFCFPNNDPQSRLDLGCD